ncbi:MAG: glycosyltransferase family 2 protein [Thermodesulfovibrionales bacterium]|nr:glycosyltransferase family 2 protein [Thermodesulfovibrionales bacterium]
MKYKIKISVAIITKDEEKRLPACLESVSFADEIVVVDSGSIDRTVDIARSFGCKVFIEEWKGYGSQKNSAIQKCTNEWVLVLDADERVPSYTKELIFESLKNPRASAYSFKMKHYINNRWLKHGGNWPDWHIRLINKNRGKFRGEIHEKWITNGTTEKINAHIDHYGFSNYAEMVETMNKYSTISAKELFASGKRANILTPIIHSITMFIKIYFLKKGFLDGLDGLVLALLKAGGSFFKYAKLLELQRGRF